jgi:hypothetical protein
MEERMFIRAMAVCIGLLAAAPASAQPVSPIQEVPPEAAPTAPPAGSEDSRYSFHRAEDGYLRLDVRTGQVSLCSRRQVGWACQVIPDDRAVLETEIGRLQSENGALKKALLSRGLALPNGVSAPQSTAKPQPKPQSRENDLDRVMTLVETMWHRLVEMVANLQRDLMKKG